MPQLPPGVLKAEPIPGLTMPPVRQKRALPPGVVKVEPIPVTALQSPGGAERQTPVPFPLQSPAGAERGVLTPPSAQATLQSPAGVERTTRAPLGTVDSSQLTPEVYAAWQAFQKKFPDQAVKVRGLRVNPALQSAGLDGQVAPDGVIEINPQSQTPFEQLFLHELGHGTEAQANVNEQAAPRSTARIGPAIPGTAISTDIPSPYVGEVPLQQAAKGAWDLLKAAVSASAAAGEAGMTGPGVEPVERQTSSRISDETVQAGNDFANGIAGATQPLIALGAAIDLPGTVLAMGTYWIAQKFGNEVAKVVGARPAMQELVGNLTGLLAAGVGVDRIARRSAAKVLEDAHAAAEQIRAERASTPARPTEPVPVGGGATEAAQSAKPALQATNEVLPPSPEPPAVAGRAMEPTGPRTPPAPTGAVLVPNEAVVADFLRAAQAGDVAGVQTARAELTRRGLPEPEAQAAVATPVQPQAPVEAVPVADPFEAALEDVRSSGTSPEQAAVAAPPKAQDLLREALPTFGLTLKSDFSDIWGRWRTLASRRLKRTPTNEDMTAIVQAWTGQQERLRVAHDAASEVAKTHAEVVKQYRARQVDDDVFLRSKAIFDAANKVYDTEHKALSSVVDRTISQIQKGQKVAPPAPPTAKMEAPNGVQDQGAAARGRADALPPGSQPDDEAGGAADAAAARTQLIEQLRKERVKNSRLRARRDKAEYDAAVAAAPEEAITRLIAKAKEAGYVGDEQPLRDDLVMRMAAIQELDAEFAESGHNGRNLLKAIAKYGGLRTRSGMYKGELDWLKEHRHGGKPEPFGALQGIQGVFKNDNDRSGQTFDGMVEALRQDPEFQHIETIDDLIMAVKDAADFKEDRTIPADKLEKEISQDWWQRVMARQEAEREDRELAAQAEAEDAAERAAIQQADEGFEPDEFERELAAVRAEDEDEPQFSKREPSMFDTLDTGEVQPRLPGAEDVREQDIKTPEFEAPFSLTSEVGKPKKSKAPSLFDEPSFSRRHENPAPVFYSALTRAAEALPMNKGIPEQMAAMLKKAKGVKQEEWDWAGVGPWLQGQGRFVTKQDIVDYLKANELQVTEVEHGESEADAETQREEREAMAARVDNARREANSTQNGVPPQVVHRLPGLAMAAANGGDEALQTIRGFGIAETQVQAIVRYGEAMNAKNALDTRHARERKPTKFSQHVLPGGESYRELLITLPLPARYDARKAVFDKYARLIEPLHRDAMNHNLSREQRDVAATERDALEAKRDAEADEAGGEAKSEDSFRGGHFDEPNVLVHIRFDDRTDVDGKKVLFIEEVQSDWAQQHRRARKALDQKTFDSLVERLKAAGRLTVKCP